MPVGPGPVPHFYGHDSSSGSSFTIRSSPSVRRSSPDGIIISQTHRITVLLGGPADSPTTTTSQLSDLDLSPSTSSHTSQQDLLPAPVSRPSSPAGGRFSGCCCIIS